eukprot:gene25057-18510_t
MPPLARTAAVVALSVIPVADGVMHTAGAGGAADLPELPHAPWGWNAYDFTHGINETKLLGVIDGFVEQLRPHGFKHVNLDAGWQGA